MFYFFWVGGENRKKPYTPLFKQIGTYKLVNMVKSKKIPYPQLKKPVTTINLKNKSICLLIKMLPNICQSSIRLMSDRAPLIVVDHFNAHPAQWFA